LRKTREERLVLVDESDRKVGEEEKLAAHRDGGKLHRAFSIFIENHRGEQLLQRRARAKYHFRGLWANACCGHPRPEEALESAARRRLREELGIDAELTELFSFAYTAEDPESGLTEKEIDHVFVGRFDGFPQPHPDEIDEIRWVHRAALARELEDSPAGFAPWLLEAAPRVLASRDAAATTRKSVLSSRGRLLFGVVAALGLVFLATVVMRSPWRGFLAQGDQYVTAEALRWLRTWDRDGAWAWRFALVLSPPTEEYQGDKKLLKWALPGHPMLVHGALWLFDLEPTVDRLMQVNLVIHLVLSLLLALLAYYLATLARPESLWWPTLTALHCGLFVLLFPPNLYWGQNLSVQTFTVLPLLVVAVAGRWLRASQATERGRRAADLAVGVAVFMGTLTDFLFWLLVPCLLVAQALRAWRRRPRASDPFRQTLLFPYLAAMVTLFVLFTINGTAGVMIDRARDWTVGGPGGGLLFFFATRLWFLVSYFRGHFYDAFRLLGFFCIGLALVKLVPRERSESVPWVARGVLLDLLVPGLAFSFVLSPHQAVHTFAAMQYVPFVTLVWAFLTPVAIDGFRGRPKRAVAWALYGSLAFLWIWPGSSGYARYFPAPEPDWVREASFLRENTLASDRVFSPTTSIEILPPQRISLGERAVHHVYGPLDILHSVGRLEDEATIALYGPRELFPLLGAGDSGVTTDAGRSLTRFPIGRVRGFVAERADASYRAHHGEILNAGLRPEAEALEPYEPYEPYEEVLRGPTLPIALHITYGRGAGVGYQVLYWKDRKHYHSVSTNGEYVVVGDERFRKEAYDIWRKVEAMDGPEADLGAFLLGAFGTAGEAVRFSWRGYDVIRKTQGLGPALLERRAPSVKSWDAFFFYAGEDPVAMALGPTAAGSAWISVVFDDVVGEIGSSVQVLEEWKIIQEPDSKKE